MKFLDCNNQFVNENDGSLYVEDYVDWLHFTEIGYQKYCESITEFIKSISNSKLNLNIIWILVYILNTKLIISTTLV